MVCGVAEALAGAHGEARVDADVHGGALRGVAARRRGQAEQGLFLPNGARRAFRAQLWALATQRPRAVVPVITRFLHAVGSLLLTARVARNTFENVPRSAASVSW